MKRGFTLLELIVVIIILGILSTLGFGQYMRMIEKARGAEARMILGAIRTAAVGHRMEYGVLSGAGIPAFNGAAAGIDAVAPVDPERLPGVCTGTHYFSYALTPDPAVEPSVIVTATRCTASGKAPNATTALTLILTSNLSTGADTWTGTGGY